MAARTRTIQRTPNVGLTLKMQPLQEAAPCEPCVPIIDGIYWWSPASGLFDAEDWSQEFIGFGAFLYTPYQTLVASVRGDLCPGCAVIWSHEWENTEEFPRVGGYPWQVVTDRDTIVFSRPAPHPGYMFDSGILTVSASVVCSSGSQALGPITYTAIVTD